MSALHTAVVASIQLALAIGAALLAWVFVGAIVHAMLRRTAWRAPPVERVREP